MRRAAAVLVVLWAELAAAQVAPNQSRPKRPLVLPDDAVDLHIGVAAPILTEPQVSAFDYVRLPIGVDLGQGDGIETGALVDLTIHPEMAMAVRGRARLDLGFDRVLALGGEVTLPLGYLSNRLGPEALPVAFEIPALRLENARAALQAALQLGYTIQEGNDPYGLSVEAAGVLRIAQSGFAVLEAGVGAPSFDWGPPVMMGAGLGVFLTEQFVLKAQARTPDVGEMNVFEVLVLVVNLSEPRAKLRDWL